MTEAERRSQGRIAAARCWEAARIAVDEETREALERQAVRYALKAIGIETEGMLATPPFGGTEGDVADLPTWEGLARQASAHWDEGSFARDGGLG